MDKWINNSLETLVSLSLKLPSLLSVAPQLYLTLSLSSVAVSIFVGGIER